MTNTEISSPVIQKFHAELQRLLELEASKHNTTVVPEPVENKVPQRRLVKLPPAQHPLFPELSLV